MANIADIRSRVLLRIKDAAKSLDADGVTETVDASIASAVEEYGKVRPRETATVCDGAATFKYSLTAATPILTGFDAALSQITSIAYPYTTTTADLTYLEDYEWKVQQLADGLWLWFITATPSAAEDFLVTWTLPHTCSGSALTVPASDYEAVADLAAAHALLAMSGLYVQSLDNSISADAVNRQSKASEYRSLSTQYRKAYDLKMGSGAATGPAFAIGDIDRLDGDGGDYFFHGRRRF